MYLLHNIENSDTMANASVQTFHSRERARIAMRESFDAHKKIVGIPAKEDFYDDHSVTISEDTIVIQDGIDSYRWEITEAKPVDEPQERRPCLLITVAEREVNVKKYDSLEAAHEDMMAAVKAHFLKQFDPDDLVEGAAEADVWEKLCKDEPFVGEYIGWSERAARSDLDGNCNMDWVIWEV